MIDRAYKKYLFGIATNFDC